MKGGRAAPRWSCRPGAGCVPSCRRGGPPGQAGLVGSSSVNRRRTSAADLRPLRCATRGPVGGRRERSAGVPPGLDRGDAGQQCQHLSGPSPGAPGWGRLVVAGLHAGPPRGRPSAATLSIIRPRAEAHQDAGGPGADDEHVQLRELAGDLRTGGVEMCQLLSGTARRRRHRRSGGWRETLAARLYGAAATRIWVIQSGCAGQPGMLITGRSSRATRAPRCRPIKR